MQGEREPLPTHVEDTPALPPDYAAAVDAGLAALGLTLEPAQRAAIDGHIRLLLAWTPAINLTAVREPAAAATVHVLDSLTAVGPLRERGIDRFLDLGSGGGLPGIPLAVALPAARGIAGRADRQEGAVPGHRRRGDRAGRARPRRRDAGRDAGRRSATTAGAGRP